MHSGYCRERSPHLKRLRLSRQYLGNRNMRGRSPRFERDTDMQKIYRDTETTVTLWGMGYDGNLTLTFTSEELINAGYGYAINLFDLQSVFQCNVTIEEKTLQTVRYDERKERFLKPLEKESAQ